jgi:hypothetical protein
LVLPIISIFTKKDLISEEVELRKKGLSFGGDRKSEEWPGEASSIGNHPSRTRIKVVNSEAQPVAAEWEWGTRSDGRQRNRNEEVMLSVRRLGTGLVRAKKKCEQKEKCLAAKSVQHGNQILPVRWWRKNKSRRRTNWGQRPRRLQISVATEEQEKKMAKASAAPWPVKTKKWIWV